MSRKSFVEERVGQIRKNTFGSFMEVVDYKNANNVTVRFLEHGNLVDVQWHKFLDGQVRNVYDKSIFGIGYISEGKYKPSINHKDTQQYRTWYRMLERCYDPKCHEKQPTYKYCSVAEEWHNFQNFAKWYDENYYEIEGQRMELDKDILIKGNKVYSPETCIFVSGKINAIFTKNDVNRGDLPIGVNKSGENYRARCMNGKGDNGRVSLGNFKTPEEAFLAYKLHKEKHLKEIAEEFRNLIPTKLYKALINYKVEITD